MRISDWSSDVCSSDLADDLRHHAVRGARIAVRQRRTRRALLVGGRTGAAGADRAGAWRRRCARRGRDDAELSAVGLCPRGVRRAVDVAVADALAPRRGGAADDRRSEEHTSELQSLMRISYAVFCLKKKITKTT